MEMEWRVSVLGTLPYVASLVGPVSSFGDDAVAGPDQHAPDRHLAEVVRQLRLDPSRSSFMCNGG